MHMSTAQRTTLLSKIIVPHDGSRSSDRALDKAIELAKALGSEIILVNIVDDRFIPPSTILAFLSDKTSLEDAKIQIIKYVKQGSEAMLKDKLEKARSQGVNIRHILVVGPPSDEITKAAQKENASLIIMGKSQDEDIREKIRALGSIVRKVSEASQIPVMIVH
jgi:nucleotide-binding universal stress UspA family protein